MQIVIKDDGVAGVGKNLIVILDPVRHMGINKNITPKILKDLAREKLFVQLKQPK